MTDDVIRTSSCPEAMMGGLMGSMMNHRDNGLEAAMLANGGMNGWQNNPFIYLVWMMFANRMWGDNGGKVQDAEIQGQLNAIRTQMQENQNSGLLMDAVKGNNVAIGQLASNLNCDFNALNNAICGVRSGIQEVAGNINFSAERVINAANLGDMNIVQQLKDCCCQTQQNIIKMGAENQLGQKDMVNGMQQGFAYTNTGLERGFANIGNLMQQLGCDLKTNSDHNTQRIVDVLSNHWQEDLQLRLNRAELELSQQRQNAALIAALGTKTTTATT